MPNVQQKSFDLPPFLLLKLASDIFLGPPGAPWFEIELTWKEYISVVEHNHLLIISRMPFLL